MVLTDVIIVTLAVGEQYAVAAHALLRHFVNGGNRALVVTDAPEVFHDLNVECIPHTAEAPYIWHSKRHAVAEGLKRAWTVYFIDADHIWNENEVVPKLERLPPGASASYGFTPQLMHLAFAKVGHMCEAANQRNLDALGAETGVVDWQSSRWWGDFLFAVTRDTEDGSGTWSRLIPTWDCFAALTSTLPFSICFGDGVALAFAAHACGWKPVWRKPEFEPILRAFRHVGFSVATWRELQARP